MQIPDNDVMYSACLGIFSTLAVVTTVSGGLCGAKAENTQAEINKLVIHLNLDWVFAATDSIEEDPMSKSSRMHKAVLVAKMLHEFTNKLTRSILTYVYTVLGLDPETDELDYNTPITIGRKSIQEKNTSGKKIAKRELGDMGLAAEELIFGYRLNLGAVLTENVFGGSDVIFSDQERNGWLFKVEARFDAWAEAVLDGPVQLNMFMVSTEDTKPLTRKRPATPAAQSSVKAQNSSSSGQVDLDFDADALKGAGFDETVYMGAGDEGTSAEEEGLIPMDVALPVGWKI